MSYYMDRLKTHPILIPSEQLEPVFANVIGGYWEEIVHAEKEEDVEALEGMKQRMMTLARVADVSRATHCIIALNNQVGMLEARIRQLTDGDY